MYVICLLCSVPMNVNNKGCTALDLTLDIDNNAVVRQPVPYGQEQRFGPQEFFYVPCHDCGVRPGRLHHIGCDMEECPFCHGQFISCGCQTTSRIPEEL